MSPPQLKYFTIKEPKNARKIFKIKKVVKMKEFGLQMVCVTA